MLERTALQSVLKDREISRGIKSVDSLISGASSMDFLRFLFEEAEACDPNEEFVVLDNGCGTGETLLTLGEILRNTQSIRADLKLIGVDLNPLQNEAKVFPQNVQLLKGNSERLPLVTGSVNVGFSVATIQYVDDALRALEEGYRVLKNGGWFFWLLNGTSDVSVFPHLETILSNTPGARAFARRFGEDDDHSVITCFKDSTDDFKGFPYRKWFSMRPLLRLSSIDKHKRRTVYRRA